MASFMKILLVCLLAIPAASQYHVGVRAGLINYARGIFYIDQKPLRFPAAQLLQIPEGKSLHTGQGWVELQLGPNAYLWLGEESALRLDDSSIESTKVTIERGSVALWIFEQTKENQFCIRFREMVIEPRKPGYYSLNGTKPQLRVYRGKASIRGDKAKAVIGKGKAVILADRLTVSTFNTKQPDPLDQIASPRTDRISRVMLQARMEQANRNRLVTRLEYENYVAQKELMQKSKIQQEQDYNEDQRQLELFKQIQQQRGMPQ